MYTNEFLLNLYERFSDKAQQALDFVKNNQEGQVFAPHIKSDNLVPDGVYYILQDGTYVDADIPPAKYEIKAIGIAYGGHYFSVPLDWNYGASRLLKKDNYPEDEYCQKEVEAILDWDFVKHTNHLKELGLAIELKEGHYLPTVPVFLAMYKNREELNDKLYCAGAEIIDFNKNFWFAQRYGASGAWIFGGTYRYLGSSYVNDAQQCGAVSLWNPKA